MTEHVYILEAVILSLGFCNSPVYKYFIMGITRMKQLLDSCPTLSFEDDGKSLRSYTGLLV